MAGRPRSRRRVRTTAQRAALKKAQAASARKRRRRRAKRVAGQGAKVVGSFAGAIAVYHLNNYARHPSKARKDYKAAKGVGKTYIRKYKTRKSPAPSNRNNGFKFGAPPKR